MNESFAISGYTSTDKIWCAIIDDAIYQVDLYGQKKLIGRTAAAYDELEATTQEYYDKLVALGVIIPPKSQEELMSEMQQSMFKMSEIISALSAEVEELRANGSKQCACSDKQDSPDRQSRRRSAAGSASAEGDA